MTNQNETTNMEMEPTIIQKPMSKEDKEALQLNMDINRELYYHRDSRWLKNQKKIKNFAFGLSAAVAAGALWTGLSDENKSFNYDARMLTVAAITLNLAGSALRRYHNREEGHIIRKVAERHGQIQKVDRVNTQPLYPEGIGAVTEGRLAVLETISTIAMLGSPFVSLNAVLITGSLAKGFSMIKDARLHNTMSEIKNNLGKAMPKRITNPNKRSIGDERGSR